MRIRILNPIYLMLLPFAAYLISYLYLAYYHGNIFIFNTIVHEGGVYSLLETTFYFSHFLGHLPILTMLSLLFTGAYLCMTKEQLDNYSPKSNFIIFFFIIFFLTISFILSLVIFGADDTFSFFLQEKQRVSIYAKGGSWNLHLPSSIMLFLLVPIYIYIFKRLLGKDTCINKSGVLYILSAAILLFLFTYILNGNIGTTIVKVWKDPRYLAHSVRELFTFPVTYFPITLYFFIKKEEPAKLKESRKFRILLLVLMIFFALGLIYQSYIPLTKGISSIAQRPFFAKGRSLGIPYLLASHYFEHFLDTVYFTLFCIFLFNLYSGIKLKLRF